MISPNYGSLSRVWVLIEWKDILFNSPRVLPIVFCHLISYSDVSSAGGVCLIRARNGWAAVVSSRLQRCLRSATCSLECSTMCTSMRRGQKAGADVVTLVSRVYAGVSTPLGIKPPGTVCPTPNKSDNTSLRKARPVHRLKAVSKSCG